MIVSSFWLVWSSGNPDRLDDLMPTIMKRVKEVQEVLVSVPKDMQTEFMYHVASYYIPVDSETELCRNHSALMYDAFLSDELWALKSKYWLVTFIGQYLV